MKLYIISNIRFGINPLNSKLWMDRQCNYFDNFLIPFLEKNYNQTDYLIITGILYDNINIDSLNFSYEIFKKLEKYNIILLHNDDGIVKYIKLFNNIKLISSNKGIKVNNNKVLLYNSGDIKDCDITISSTKRSFISNKVLISSNKVSDINMGSIMQYHKSSENDKHGIYVIDGNINFIENKISPVYKTIYINNIDDFNNINNIDNIKLIVDFNNRDIKRKLDDIKMQYSNVNISIKNNELKNNDNIVYDKIEDVLFSVIDETEINNKERIKQIILDNINNYNTK